MSDQQLVTGFAIMIGAYSQLQCSLSICHWKMTTMLTWFSTTTHLATLPFLRRYLEIHRFVLFLRVFLMFALAIILAVALIPSPNLGYYNPATPSNLATPAKCIMSLPSFGFNFIKSGMSAIISEIILFGALLTRLIRMFPATRDVSTHSLKSVQTMCRHSIIWACRKLERIPRVVGIFTAPPLLISLVYLVSIHALFNLLRSGAFEVGAQWGMENFWIEAYSRAYSYYGYSFP